MLRSRRAEFAAATAHANARRAGIERIIAELFSKHLDGFGCVRLAATITARSSDPAAFDRQRQPMQPLRASPWTNGPGFGIERSTPWLGVRRQGSHREEPSLLRQGGPRLLSGASVRYRFGRAGAGRPWAGGVSLSANGSSASPALDVIDPLLRFVHLSNERTVGPCAGPAPLRDTQHSSSLLAGCSFSSKGAARHPCGEAPETSRSARERRSRPSLPLFVRLRGPVASRRR